MFTSSLLNFWVFKCVRDKLHCRSHPLDSFCGLGGIRKYTVTICRKAVCKFGSLYSAWREQSGLIHLHDEQEPPKAKESEKLRREGVVDAVLLVRQVINLCLPPNVSSHK